MNHVLAQGKLVLGRLYAGSTARRLLAFVPVLVISFILALLFGGVARGSRLELVQSLSGYIGLFVFFVTTVVLTGMLLASRDVRPEPSSIVDVSLGAGLRIRENEARQNVALRKIHYQYCFWVAVVSAVAAMLLLVGLLLEIRGPGPAIKDNPGVAVISGFAAATGLWAGVSLRLYSRAASELKLALRHAERLGDQVLTILLFREELGKIVDPAMADELRRNTIEAVVAATFSGRSMPIENTKKPGGLESFRKSHRAG